MKKRKMQYKKDNRNNKLGEGTGVAIQGITLITLVITIVILIMLAGVVINLTIGQNGIFNTAKYAVSETKKKQVQEEIQLAVTDIITKYLSGETELTNTILKEELEKYNSLQGITVDENLVGTYKSYNYYIDETYTVHIGDKIDQPIIAKIVINEENRKITATITDVKKGINKIEIINPKGEIILSKEPEKVVAQENLEAIANLSGIYKVKVTDKNNETQEKAITVKKVEIRNKEELVELGKMVNGGVTFEGDTVTLLADIDLGGNDSNRNWKTMGNNGQGKYFAGIFEGNNHKIYKIYNTDTNKNQQGLFGAINGGTVQNLGIESGNIIGTWTSGGIVGRLDNGNIINCYNKAKIEGGDIENYVGNIGGIAGTARGKSIIQNCYNEGKIEGSSEMNGGIAGNVLEGTKILSCYNIGNIIGYRYIGGIIGYIQDKDSIINNCYNKGNIEATGDVAGGIVGENRTESEVKNCYNIGTASALTTRGGVIGYNAGKLTNVFYTGRIEDVYGGCGVNNTEYRTNPITEDNVGQLTDILNGEQNSKPWKADENNINGGYPTLSWQKILDLNE